MQFVTYNQALMQSRTERICVICAALVAVALAESIGANPTWLVTGVGVIIAQILVVKCWADMVIMSRPHENCWAFNDKTGR